MNSTNENELEKAIENAVKRAELSKAVGILLSEYVITNKEASIILAKIARMDFCDKREYLPCEDLDLIGLWKQAHDDNGDGA